MGPIGVIYMKIDIAGAVKNEGEVYSEGYDGPLKSLDFMGEHFEFPSVHVTVQFHFDGEGLVVGGSFKADIEVNCSRCLKTFVYPVSFEFSEYFKKQPGEDDGIYPLTTDIVDLSTMLLDNIVMALPMRFLCREDCKGLCSICGRDLNESDCECSPEMKNQFGALAGLYDNEEE